MKRSGFHRSENWGQLYLHDLQTGKLKHPITSGDGNVTQLLRVDEPTRTVYFQGVGKEAGRDPYFRHFYRESMDGKPAQLLTPEDADHDISLCAIRQVLRRQLFEARHARRPRCCAIRPAR